LYRALAGPRSSGMYDVFVEVVCFVANAWASFKKAGFGCEPVLFAAVEGRGKGRLVEEVFGRDGTAADMGRLIYQHEGVSKGPEWRAVFWWFVVRVVERVKA